MLRRSQRTWHAWTLFTRESGDLGRNLRGIEVATSEATGKVSNRTPVVASPEESDGNILPGKSANNGAEVSAESMEERTPTKRNLEQEAANRIQSRSFALNGLGRVRQRVYFDAKYLR